jgi:peroxiredoxin Q/BCP
MATHLQVGDKAPVFRGRDQTGKQVSLKDFKGKKLVLFFYPENDTPACTAQACNLRDNFSLLKERGYEIIGISPNDAESHKSFIEKFQLPFTLLPDPDHKIIEQFGVWGEKNLYGRKYMGLIRTSFVIDESGKIIKILRKPRTKSHAEEIVK